MRIDRINHRYFQLPTALEQGEALHGLVQQGAEGTLQEAR